MLHYFTYTILSLKFVQYFYLNLKSKVVFRRILKREREISDTFFARDRIESTQRGWREAERLKSVKRNETHTGGRTGSNRVSLVFQHPPWARSSSAAFAKGEKRSNRYSVFVLSDVKRIGRDKTSGAEEGWNEPFHRGVVRCNFSDLRFPPFPSTAHCPSRYL